VDAYKAERKQILEAFGLKLAKRREGIPTETGKVVSQEELGKRANIHRNEIGLLERGQRQPGLLTLLILAKVLDVSLVELTEDLPDPQERQPRRPRRGSPAAR
jgi:transcriptional regulator with XRE-family HTH domain